MRKWGNARVDIHWQQDKREGSNHKKQKNNTHEKPCHGGARQPAIPVHMTHDTCVMMSYQKVMFQLGQLLGLDADSCCGVSWWSASLNHDHSAFMVVLKDPWFSPLQQFLLCTVSLVVIVLIVIVLPAPPIYDLSQSLLKHTLIPAFLHPLVIGFLLVRVYQLLHSSFSHGCPVFYHVFFLVFVIQNWGRPTLSGWNVVRIIPE